MRERKPRLVLDPDAAAAPTSVRVTVVRQDSAHPLLDSTEDDWVTTAPHLFVREVAAFGLLVTGLALISYFFDAPLLDVADPGRTPNPSKAPWYFLGIQELLHYYPPLISGVLLPALAVVALLVIPYFPVNVERPALLRGAEWRRQLAAVWAFGAMAQAAFFLTSSAGPVWPLIGVTGLLLVMMALPLVVGRSSGLGAWIVSRSLAFWIFTWFTLSWVLLTVIGVYFRGPGWTFTLPWRDGIYG